jgi:hypothetical protein
VETVAAAHGAATAPNGHFFNGTRLDPLRFDGLRLDGRSLSGVLLDGASLSAASPGGGRVSGSDLVGAEFAGTLAGGGAVTLRIDGVTAGSEPAVERYQVSLQEAGGPFQPLCADGNGAAAPAIPLTGWWDPSEGTPRGGAHVDDPGTFTFACEGYALAKCVELGYAPWRSVEECRSPGDCESRSLAPFHEACTRLLRADYCGDGTTTTRDGTPVDLWDRYGLQRDDQPAWAFEAEWSPAGAVCVDQTRWATLPDGDDVRAYVLDHCPERWQSPGCGGDGSTFFSAAGFDVPLASRALLRTRVTAQP